MSSGDTIFSMFRFTIRDVLWLMVVVGMGCAWLIDRQQRFNAGPSQFPTLTDSQVMETWQRLNMGTTGTDLFAEWKRGNVSIDKDRIAEYDELPTSVGHPSRIHHTHYRCTTHSAQTKETETLFIDLNQVGYINSPPIQQQRATVWTMP